VRWTAAVAACVLAATLSGSSAALAQSGHEHHHHGVGWGVRTRANIRLDVHQPENRAALAGDPGAGFIVGGYAGHYCNVPQREGIVACSFILSGLRVFDIRNPSRPREIAYYNTPKEPTIPGDQPTSYAMSSPSFVPERGEIWYTDGNSGFYAVRVTNGVWDPAPRAGRSRPPR
jgi:hypothetical protein